jgi:hypothetical protein
VPQYIHSAAMLNLKLVQVISEQKDSLCIWTSELCSMQTNGGTQAEAVADLLRNMNSPVTCFQNIKIVPDFAGICRFVTAIHCWSDIGPEICTISSFGSSS